MVIGLAIGQVLASRTRVVPNTAAAAVCRGVDLDHGCLIMGVWFWIWSALRHAFLQSLVPNVCPQIRIHLIQMVNSMQNDCTPTRKGNTFFKLVLAIVLLRRVLPAIFPRYKPEQAAIGACGNANNTPPPSSQSGPSMGEGIEKTHSNSDTSSMIDALSTEDSQVCDPANLEKHDSAVQLSLLRSI